MMNLSAAAAKKPNMFLTALKCPLITTTLNMAIKRKKTATSKEIFLICYRPSGQLSSSQGTGPLIELYWTIDTEIENLYSLYSGVQQKGYWWISTRR